VRQAHSTGQSSRPPWKTRRTESMADFEQLLALEDGVAQRLAVFSDSLRSGSASIWYTSGYQSRSTRCRANRNCARATGSTGISGDAEIVRPVLHDHRESYRTRSRSTSVAGYDTDSGRAGPRADVPATLMMSMPMPFSATRSGPMTPQIIGSGKQVMMDRRLDKGLTPCPLSAGDISGYSSSTRASTDKSAP